MQDTNNLEITSRYFDKFSAGLKTIILTFLKVSNFRSVKSDIRSVYNRVDVIKLLIFSKFLESTSIHGLVQSDLHGIINCGKDVYYSIKNNVKINWRLLMFNQAIECINQLDIDMKTQISHQVPCLIADDTDIPKRGKLMEMIGKIFSHVGHKYNLGYKSLNLSYWTGKTMIHLDFSMHVESRKEGNQGLTKKELKARYTKLRPNDSHGSKRISESVSKKTVSLKSMVGRAIDNGLKARYLLVDSWFFNSDLVRYIKSTTLDLITRPKKNNWQYTHQNRTYTIGQLLNKYKNHKKRKWSRLLKMYYIKLEVSFKGNELVLYFYKPKKRGSKWQILISTKKNLSPIKAYELYQNRWSIEVAYKELKQHFKYGKCQSRDFSGQIADHTICLMAYNFMSTFKCANEYESIGALFKEIKHNWIRPTVMEEFWKYMKFIAHKIAEQFGLLKENVMKILIRDDDFMKIFNLDQLKLTTET